MTKLRSIALALVAAAAFAPAVSRAHCDTLDGPVAKAAQAALDTGKLEPVLAWVQPGDEAQIRDAFAKARAARKGSKDAREVADRWFLETLVRVHRAGEGAPYTGLKAAGLPVDPAVAAVDQAAASGDPAAIEKLLVGAVHEGLAARWAALAAQRPPASDVAAGRRWVAAYVPLVHWAEAIRATALGQGEGHGAGAEGRPAAGEAHGAAAAQGGAGAGGAAPEHADAADPHAQHR